MKKTAIFLLLLISISVVSASTFQYDGTKRFKEEYSETKYYPESHMTVTKKLSVDYLNDERYPTYDYRNGYTYRNTKPYFEKQYNFEEPKKSAPKKSYHNYDKPKTQSPKHNRNYDDDYYDNYRYRNRNKPVVQYKYVPYLRELQPIKCYVNPPKGKLFYIKCPN